MGKTAERNDYTKLGVMLVQLRKIKSDMLKGSENAAYEKKQEEMKGMDEFRRRKYELNALLEKIRENVKKLEDVRRDLPPNSRDKISIGLMSKNTKDLSQARWMFKELHALLLAEDRKKKQTLSEKELEDRRKIATLLGKEIVDLTNKNSCVKVVTTKADQEMEQRVKTRTQQKRETREARKQERKQKRGKSQGLDVEEALEDVTLTAQEQEFMDQVHANVEEQDEMLDEIHKGLLELKHLGQDMKKNFELQKQVIHEIDINMDETQSKMENAHGRLNDVLRESGGITRWCPLLVCMVILLALVGYILNMITH